MGPRSRNRVPTRRDVRAASTRLAARACSGQASRETGRRAPRTRSALPSTTGAATRARSAGSREPSQSMKHTTSSVAARSPAKHADPKPRWGSLITTAPDAAAIDAVASTDPLSTTIGRKPTGKRSSTRTIAGASSSAGSTTSITRGSQPDARRSVNRIVLTRSETLAIPYDARKSREERPSGFRPSVPCRS